MPIIGVISIVAYLNCMDACQVSHNEIGRAHV